MKNHKILKIYSGRFSESIIECAWEQILVYKKNYFLVWLEFSKLNIKVESNSKCPFGITEQFKCKSSLLLNKSYKQITYLMFN